MSRSRYLANPAVRFVLAVITFVLIMHLLNVSWRNKEKDKMPAGGSGQDRPSVRERERLVVAHFMVRPRALPLTTEMNDQLMAGCLAGKHVPLHRDGLEDATSPSRGDWPVSASQREVLSMTNQG